MFRCCRATKNVHRISGPSSQPYAVSRIPFQVQRTNPPPKTPGPMLCNGRSNIKWYHHHQTPCHIASAALILRSDLFGRVQGTAQITCHSPPSQHASTHKEESHRTAGNKTHLALTIRPKIHPAPDNIVQRRVGRLVQQHGAQRRERQPEQPRHHAAVQVRARHPAQRPFVGEAHERDGDVEDLQDGDGLDGGVEVFGQEVEEEFGPEEGFEGAG